MLRILVVSILLSSAAIPALADDPKQEVEKLGAAYAENVAKKDPAGVAALYSKDGVIINSSGVHSDITELYKGNFKNGLERLEIRTGHIWPINNDTVIAEGETDIFGKNASGEATKVTIFWSALDIRENGQMKIRMLTAAPKPAPK